MLLFDAKPTDVYYYYTVKRTNENIFIIYIFVDEAGCNLTKTRRCGGTSLANGRLSRCPDNVEETSPVCSYL